jgi:hypothetical protein
VSAFFSIQFPISKISIQTEGSVWFIGLCLLAGLLYASILYSKKTPWTKIVNRILAGFRFILVAVICFLFLGPLLNQTDFFYEKPIVVLAVDNSVSLPSAYDSLDFESLKAQLSAFTNELSGLDYELKIRSLDGYKNTFQLVDFNQEITNLQGLLKNIEKEFEQQNLIGVVLASDGIHNYGLSPEYVSLNYPVYSIAMGDTIPLMDLSLKAISYNKIVYEGNRFPLIAEVFNNGYVNENITVQVLKNGNKIAEQNLLIKGDQQINSLEFILDAENAGIENYKVQIVGKSGETTVVNNSRNAFLEVVESKQKILIAAKSPHPDIKAIRSVIDKNEGTETALYLDGITEEIPEGPFDLIIMHQLPDFNILPQWLTNALNQSSTWFITGTGNLSRINELNEVMELNEFGQTDLVSGNVNPNFELFEIEESLLDRMSTYPPITVPYGQTSFKQPSDILLFQMVGSVTTNRPLLAIYNGDDKKSAVLAGSGIWKWKLQEAGLNQDQKMFDEIFGKLIQFLTTNDDKRNFRVATSSNEYFDSEAVEFKTEIYNELFEKVYDYSVDLTITDADGTIQEFNYVNSANNNYSLSGLTPGIYKFSAAASVTGKREIAQGTFSIEKLALEDINITANHNLLRTISSNSGGASYDISSMDQIIEVLESKNANPTVRSDEKLRLLLNNPLWLFLLIALVSTEWFIRKYNGSY